MVQIQECPRKGYVWPCQARCCSANECKVWLVKGDVMCGIVKYGDVVLGKAQLIIQSLTTINYMKELDQLNNSCSAKAD